MRIAQPFHAGELRVQAELGERALATIVGRSIADAIMAPAFGFLARQPLIVLARADLEHGCDVTLLFGAPGFLRPRADGSCLEIGLDPTRDRTTDPVLAALAAGARVGCLAIDLSTRRRLRINGEIAKLEPERLELAVAESFPNCPKHISKRELTFEPSPAWRSGASASGTRIGPEQRAIIRAADTFFVASYNPGGHVDASHRGGPPGFVRIDDDDVLEIPDFPGNSMFNTLGNLAVTDAAALVFVDFERGLLLHLRGRTQLCLGAATGRSWRFAIERWQTQPGPVETVETVETVEEL
jgi:hypothetical protein